MSTIRTEQGRPSQTYVATKQDRSTRKPKLKEQCSKAQVRDVVDIIAAELMTRST